MFYRLSWPADGKYATCAPLDPQYDPAGAEVCPLCGKKITGSCWQHPRTLKIVGRKFPDFLFPTPYPAVSERFRELYVQYGLNGIQCFDLIENYKTAKNTPTPPRYFTLRTVWSAMQINYAESEIAWLDAEQEHRCALCSPSEKVSYKIHRLVLEEENYNGEDIFRIYATGNALYLSERFVHFVKETGLTNLAVRPIDDYAKRYVL